MGHGDHLPTLLVCKLVGKLSLQAPSGRSAVWREHMPRFLRSLFGQVVLALVAGVIVPGHNARIVTVQAIRCGTLFDATGAAPLGDIEVELEDDRPDAAIDFLAESTVERRPEVALD